MELSSKKIECEYRINDEIVINKSKGEVKTIKDVRYSYEDGCWYYKLNNSKYHKVKSIDTRDDVCLDRKACPSCLTKGDREKSRFRCSTDSCETRLFDGMTLTVQQNTVKAPSIEVQMEVSDSRQIDDIQYSLEKHSWLFKSGCIELPVDCNPLVY
jgi:hypothetical protein